MITLFSTGRITRIMTDGTSRSSEDSLNAIDGRDLARSIISNGHARRKDTVIIDGRGTVKASVEFIGAMTDILAVHHVVHIDLIRADETIIDLFKNAVRLYPDMNVNAWE